MALIQLAKAIAADPAAGEPWALDPLLLAIAYRASSPPGSPLCPSRRGRGCCGRRWPMARTCRHRQPAASGLMRRALAPAEQRGLVTLTDRAPLPPPPVRSAIYHSAPFTQRAAAHRHLAGALHGQPDRRAWHLAAAALHPDERVLAAEATAVHAQRCGGAAAAALAMERAAELSPAPEDQARRLVSAASDAVTAGQGDWVQDLAAPRADGDSGPGAAAASAQHRLLGAGLLGPPLGRVRRSSSRSRKRPRLTTRPWPGRPWRTRPPSPTRRARPPAVRPSAVSCGCWKTASRCRPPAGPPAGTVLGHPPAGIVDTGVHRPVREPRSACRGPAADRPRSARRGRAVASRLGRVAA